MNSDGDKLRVMHLILDLELAGAQECLCTLAEYWPFDNYVLKVCAYRDGPLRQRIEKSGTEVTILRRSHHGLRNRPMFLAELWRIRRDLIRYARAKKVDLIQTHILGPLDFIALSLRWTKHVKAVLWTVHGTDFLPQRPGRFLQFRRLAVRWLYRLLESQVDAFVAVSDAVCEALINQLGPIKHRVFTINNGVNLRRFHQPVNRATLCAQLGISPRANLILTVGRLVEEKGHRYLIEAIPRVLSAHHNTHFLFAGKGEIREMLESLARGKACLKNIHFLGVRTDVPSLLAAADVFVLPSLREGLSMALLEAMAAAKPIVATAVSGTTKVMNSEKTGLIVPPRDSHALAQGINQLLSDTARAQAMGQACRRHVMRNYSAEKQAAKYLSLYDLLLRSIRD